MKNNVNNNKAEIKLLEKISSDFQKDLDVYVNDFNNAKRDFL